MGAAALPLIMIHACSNGESDLIGRDQPLSSLEVSLPPPDPMLGEMMLLNDEEIATLLIGKKVADGPVSFYSNYLPNGVYVREQDLGIIRTGGYRITQSALCTHLSGSDTTNCLRFYRTRDGEVFVVLIGREASPSRLNIVGPTTLR